MSGLHPDDLAFLDTVEFSSTDLRRYCDGCELQRDTVVVGAVEAESGPGWDIRLCRSCVAAALTRTRAAAGQGPHRPHLPACY
ncbi:hypothetical protein [Streptacidiphilus carbonis]|uniref:hypothetical protein n=1 Tax=Streptacidiphilus carbonis TaxID=105422 RepID=UPI0005A7D42E|nr:hypothetical protein [Streptacidiphilus carbonis]